MKEPIKWFKDSVYIKPLSKACKMCAQGAKLVILITGICSSNCFYCPLSKNKIGKDRIFVNEWKLKNEDDIQKLILESKYIEASGAGITGGDPLSVWKRTRNFILLLKDIFGSKYHIHLYTSGLKNYEHIEDIISAGLDEIRFHPLPINWKNMDKSKIKYAIKESLKYQLDVAIEIPSIPNMENDIFSLIRWSDETGLHWVNINELEFSETNTNQLLKLGYNCKNDTSSAVLESQEAALYAINRSLDNNLSIGVHYCSSSFKDRVQLKNRIMRRAKNIASEIEIISRDGTLLKGVIYSKNVPMDKAMKILTERYNVPKNHVKITKNRIEIGAWILEKIALDLNKLGFECFLIEEYPTADKLEVERIPLPM
jgi:pyruvate formate-lyase activating enzyme-like uncharacterized protein